MKPLYSVFFGAGVAAYVYSRWGRRIGYSNTKNIWTFTGIIFILTSIIFYTILAFLL